MKPEITSTAAIPSPPSLYGFGINRHQHAQNAFSRTRTDRSFTISCLARSWARPAEVPEDEYANVRLDRSFDGKPVLAVGTEDRLPTNRREKGESEGGEIEKGVIEEVDGRGERTRREKKASGVEGKIEGGGWKRGGRGGCKVTEEEEKKAVAVIAGLLREKFGPQIVREEEEEEEEGFKNGRIMDEEEAKGRQEEEEEVGNGDEETEGAEVEGEEDQEWEEGEDAEAEAGAEASEEDGPPTTSPPTRPPRRNGPRVVSPSSLLSLYRFFSSHLGISSPATVASLLASHPALLRSDPASDLLPRVHLLQSYGLSRADISAITMRNASWLRTSLPQVREKLDFLLARGVRRTMLDSVLRKSHYLIAVQPRSTNLDILVEKAGVPVEKLGLLIERGPDILCVREEIILSRLEQLSAYFTDGYGEGRVNSGHLRQHLNRQHKDKNPLSRFLVQYPRILLRSPERIATNLRLLQSFTPPDSPSVAVPVLLGASTLVSHTSQNILSKLQYLEKLLGKKATGSVVRSYTAILVLSVDNMQGKVELLSDLIGREKAVLAVARYPLLLGANEENLKRGFSKLVREVEEALEGGEDDGYARESPPVEEPQKDAKDARKLAGQGGSSAEARAGEGRGSKNTIGCSTAREMVANLVVMYPTSICYSWEGNTRHKVEYLKRDMGLSIKEVLVFPQFLGYSLYRRIRPRHLALLSKGYVFVPHEVARPKYGEGVGHLKGISIGGRRGEGKEAAGEDVGGKGEFGMRKHEDRTALKTGERIAQDGYAGSGREGVVAVGRLSQRREKWRQGKKAVCPSQFLACTDKEFEKRFEVELTPFMPKTRPLSSF